MVDNISIMQLRFYGISPWEMEVIHGLFSNKFRISQEETEEVNSDFVSGLTIIIPIQFSILKEMKRRRGRGKAIITEIVFTGNPNVRFVADLNQSHLFNNSIEKIDFMLELLPYHLNEDGIPKNLSEVIYKFDTDASKWRLNVAMVGDKKFITTKKGWQIIP